MNGDLGAGVVNVVGVCSNEDRRNRVTLLDEVKCPPFHSNPDLQRGSVERQHRVNSSGFANVKVTPALDVQEVELGRRLSAPGATLGDDGV